MKNMLDFRKNVLAFLFSVFMLPLFSQADMNSKIELTKIGVYKCGKQPKQVLFSPDNKYILMPLLDDDGFDVFSLDYKKVIKRINPPMAFQKGFAEGIFIPGKNIFLVSQMTTGKVYEYSYPEFTYVREIDTNGVWSKFIAYNSKKNLLAVSNWVSNDVSLIDYDSGKIVRKINTGRAPRGMCFVEDGDILITLSFDSGMIEKFSTVTYERLGSIFIEKAAMRHIVVNENESKAFVSDMYHRCVYKIDLKHFKIEKTQWVFNNPNTIDLYKDRYLFVSCRGPNNPEDYTKRSLVNGQIFVIDTQDFSVVKKIEGGNQPTGLDVSNDGKYLCFSDFQDAAIQIFELK